MALVEEAARRKESDISLIMERDKELRAMSHGSILSMKVWGPGLSWYDLRCAAECCEITCWIYVCHWQYQ
jgi:hypothetical protein